MTPEKLKLAEFRRRVVAGSFPTFPHLGAALEGLRFVQADPIRSPARAQDLILRQRLAGYEAGQLEREFPGLRAEEGFLFAYGFMDPEVWRDLRWRSRSKLSAQERAVLDFVAESGEVHPRGLDERFGKRAVKNYWGGRSRATKRILEDLHDDGFLRISRREKGVRVYQVPADDAAGSETNPATRYRRLALTTAEVFGPTSKRFLMAELKSLNHLVGKRSERERLIEDLVDSGELSEVVVEGVPYVWIREQWMEKAGEDEATTADRVRILAPFDPLVRNRERFEQLWGWRYRFEAYVPAAKRERGYYAMPLLWREAVIGWVNAKVAKKRLELEVGFVGKRPRSAAFRKSLESESEALAIFLGLESGAWEWTRNGEG